MNAVTKHLHEATTPAVTLTDLPNMSVRVPQIPGLCTKSQVIPFIYNDKKILNKRHCQQLVRFAFLPAIICFLCFVVQYDYKTVPQCFRSSL